MDYSTNVSAHQPCAEPRAMIGKKFLQFHKFRQTVVGQYQFPRRQKW
jgi:hypothetical protein